MLYCIFLKSLLLRLRCVWEVESSKKTLLCFFRNCGDFTAKDIVSIMLSYVKVAASFPPLQCYFTLTCLLWDKKNSVSLISSLFLSHVSDLLVEYSFVYLLYLCMSLVEWRSSWGFFMCLSFSQLRITLFVLDTCLSMVFSIFNVKNTFDYINNNYSIKI